MRGAPFGEEVVEQALVAALRRAVLGVPRDELGEARRARSDHHDTRVELVGGERVGRGGEGGGVVEEGVDRFEHNRVRVEEEQL